MLVPRTAVVVVFEAVPAPMARRMRGATNSLKIVSADVGLPGSPIVGTPSIKPITTGLPGLMLIPCARVVPFSSIILYMISPAPADVLPDVSMISHSSVAVSIASSISASLSRIIPYMMGVAPHSMTPALSAYEFVSYIFPGSSGSPGRMSSSPVDIIPTFTLAERISRFPIAESTPISREPIRVPLRSTRSPLMISEPARMMFSPMCTGRSMNISLSCRFVCSTITTASAPSGIGAPVAISTASPSSTKNLSAHPAATIPISFTEQGLVSLA